MDPHALPDEAVQKASDVAGPVYPRCEPIVMAIATGAIISTVVVVSVMATILPN